MTRTDEAKWQRLEARFDAKSWNETAEAEARAFNQMKLPRIENPVCEVRWFFRDYASRG